MGRGRHHVLVRAESRGCIVGRVAALAAMPEANSFSDAGPDLWHCLGWQPNDTQLSQLKELQSLLRHWNSRVNLTRLVENEEFWIAQVFDSLWPLKHELRAPDLPRRCIDVGTGGGFPGLAVAIALPGTTLTLVDSVGRKTAAVESMANSLGLGARVDVRTERIAVSYTHLTLPTIRSV